MKNVKFKKATQEAVQAILLNPAKAIKKVVKKQGCMTVHFFVDRAGEVLAKKIISPQGGVGFHLPI